MRAMFECVAVAIKNKGIRGLCELVPGGQYLIDVCGEAFKLWRERRRDAKLRDELDRVAAASTEEARKTAEEVARQVMGEERSEDEAVLGLYLTQIPGAVRASLRRTGDPTGRTVPPELAVNSPEELARLLPQRAPRFRAGMDLPGRSGWKLEELLGAGGFGEVWLVRHTFIPQARAVKFCTEPRLRTRLTSHEGKVVARIMGHRNHPHVVTLLDAVLEGESPWLMYEYVAGGDLTELIQEWQKLAAAERQRLTVMALQQLAGAVSTFHRLAPPIVHRDLKPANILVEPARETRDIRLTVELKITDFGIGGVAGDLSGGAGPIGASPTTGILVSSLRRSFTPLYASPQQRAGCAPDPRDDIHALGVIGFHIMTGRLTEAPGIDAVDDLRDAGAGDELIAILARCIATKADRRFADAAELADQFQRLDLAIGASKTISSAERQSTARRQRAHDTTDRSYQPPLFEGQKQHSLFSPSERAAESSAQLELIRCVIPLRGSWFSRQLDAPVTAWPETGTKIPSEVTARPGEAYLLKLNPETATDAELAKVSALAALPGLEAIDLSACTLVTDAGLLHLASIRGLRTMLLNDTLITDAGLARLLADLPDVERIELRGTAYVSRAIIPDLMRMRSLSYLILPPRLDTVDVRVELARRRPACTVK